jgi:hypothetical protein
MPSKIYRNWEIRFENEPSGSPGAWRGLRLIVANIPKPLQENLAIKRPTGYNKTLVRSKGAVISKCTCQ